MISGYQNEINIVSSLNNKTYDQLDNNLKKLISKSFKDYAGTIICQKQGGQNKSDMIITIGNESHTYSIKIGSGNSIHQEPLESFIDFLSNNYNIADETKDNIRFFIWGDNSLDGSGNKEDRINSTKLKKDYPDKIKDIQSFFSINKKSLIKRFLITGSESGGVVDYIYFGDPEKGYCCSANRLLDWAEKNNSNGAISIGILSFQAWNRNINGGNSSEKKRGVIQLKWGTMHEDIYTIK